MYYKNFMHIEWHSFRAIDYIVFVIAIDNLLASGNRIIPRISAYASHIYYRTAYNAEKQARCISCNHSFSRYFLEILFIS